MENLTPYPHRAPVTLVYISNKGRTLKIVIFLVYLVSFLRETRNIISSILTTQMCGREQEQLGLFTQSQGNRKDVNAGLHQKHILGGRTSICRSKKKKIIVDPSIFHEYKAVCLSNWKTMRRTVSTERILGFIFYLACDLRMAHGNVTLGLSLSFKLSLLPVVRLPVSCASWLQLLIPRKGVRPLKRHVLFREGHQYFCLKRHACTFTFK